MIDCVANVETVWILFFLDFSRTSHYWETLQWY